MKHILGAKLAAGLIAATVSSLGIAKVVGPRSESLGLKAGAKVEFADWLEKPAALLTPQTSQLALQACFRASQEQLDAVAYQVTHNAVAALAKVYRSDINSWSTPEELGMVELTALLSDIDAIQPKEQFARPAEYESTCQQTVADRIAKSPHLEVVYAGRLHPQVPASLASRNLRLTPLTFDGLKDQICKLEGYYSTSVNPALWKFFSLTRAMMNVLPAESRSDAFVAAASRAPEVAPLLRQVDQYSSIAGKYNGAALGMSRQEALSAPLRQTGPAMGSRATSMLAFFTTAWRERLQQITMDRPYPQQPFQLITLAETLGALQSQLGERQTHALSSTEVAMESLSNSLITIYGPSRRPLDKVYGDVTQEFLSTSGLAWLALNAETNIRQNEKIPGVEATSIEVPKPITTQVYGSPLYASQVEQIADARKAYAAIDPQGQSTPACVNGLDAYVQAAAKVPNATVQKLSDGATDVFRGIEFKPVIADIGQEVKDDEDGAFRLHLATGYGREVPLAIKGGSYTGWTPSAFVLHLPNLVSTSEWQSGLVNQYDNP